jgi:hypothetical protein
MEGCMDGATKRFQALDGFGRVGVFWAEPKTKPPKNKPLILGGVSRFWALWAVWAVFLSIL